MLFICFMLFNTSADAKTYGFDDYKIKDGFKYTISITGDECLIFSYIGTKKDIVIPEEIDGVDKIYVQLERLLGKNNQVRSIHLSKNVLSTNGNVFCADWDWLDKEDKIYYNGNEDGRPFDNFKYDDQQNWERITVDEDNPNFIAIDGVLYSKSMETMEMIPSRISGTFTVPDSVVSIVSFPENSRISHFILGRNVLSFECGNLSQHKYLKKLTVAKGNRFFVMKKGVLYSRDMKKIYGSINVKGTYRIPSTVKRINGFAFASSGLTRVVFSDTLVDIGPGAFADCRKLKKVDFGKKLGYIYEGAFYKTPIKKLVLPKSTKGVYLAYQSFKKLITSNGRLKIMEYGWDEDLWWRITNPRAKEIAKKYKIKLVLKQ